MNFGDSPPRVGGRRPLILWVRKMHLYLGVLFAAGVIVPAILVAALPN